MNFFSKNRLVFWLMIFLVVVNISAFITFIVFFLRNPAPSAQDRQGNPGNSFRHELSLSPSQSGKVNSILADYRTATEPVAADIRDYRAQILGELAKEKPDTALLNSISEEVCQLQKQLQKASVKQYMALKEICNPEQCKKLSALYYEMYGCQGQCKAMMGKGKGMMHRNRSGNCCQDSVDASIPDNKK
jgi:Spy/CpxP family protein refolding chaperone